MICDKTTTKTRLILPLTRGNRRSSHTINMNKTFPSLRTTLSRCQWRKAPSRVHGPMWNLRWKLAGRTVIQMDIPFCICKISRIPLRKRRNIWRRIWTTLSDSYHMLTVQSIMNTTIQRCKDNRTRSNLQEMWSLLGLGTNPQAWAIRTRGWVRERLGWLSLIRWLNQTVRQSSAILCPKVVARPSAEFKRLQIHRPPTPSWSSKCRHLTKNLTESKIGSAALKTGRITALMRRIWGKLSMKTNPRNLRITSITLLENHLSMSVRSIR